MSAPESSPLVADLQESIEHLIVETVRRSQTGQDEENQTLRAALQTALADIEQGQKAIAKAADTLRSALGEGEPTRVVAAAAVEAIPPTVTEVPAPVVETNTISGNGPHDLDVIAHDVTIGIATSLQSLLRERPEVADAQTREFVNGELRLQLRMSSGLDTQVLNDWIGQHGGRITTQTPSVLELRFGN